MASQDQVPPTAPSTSTNESDVIVKLPEGITIRRLRQSDVPSMCRHANNKKVWNNVRNRMPHPYTEESAKSWIDHNNDPTAHVRCGPWTMETGSQGPPIPRAYTIAINDEAVGSIGLEFGALEDVYARTAEIGYWIGEEYWGKGIMSAVVPAFVDWTWNTFGILVRLNAEVYERNIGSRRCLEKAGFEFEGIKKCAYMKNGLIGNAVVLGAIRHRMESNDCAVPLI